MQARLVALGVVAAVVASLTFAMLFYRGQAIQAEAEAARARADLALAEAANRRALDVIASMEAQARIDSRLTADLVEEMRRITEGLAEQAGKLEELERSNEDVRAYLDSVVPADLRKLRGR